MKLVVFSLVMCMVACHAQQEVGVGKLTVVYQWKQLSYNIDGNSVTASRFSGPAAVDDGGWSFPEEDEPADPEPAPVPEAQQVAAPQADQFFVQYNNVPMGVDRYKDRIFVTVPRRRAGIPATLNYLKLGEDGPSAGLRPYPNLAANSLTSQQPLVSVYRTRVDACGRLWMVDTGVAEIPGAFRTVQPPAIVIYDLKTDQLISRYEFTSGSDYIFDDPTGFTSITVDVDKKDCSNAFAYINDLLNYGLVVYSLKENRSWRVNHNYFYFDPEEGDFDLNGLQWQWNDGVFSVALGPVQGDGFRTAYFHAMASYKERSVSTALLRNETLATRRYHGSDFKTVGSRGPNSQTTVHAVHGTTGVAVGAQVGRNALSCWNTRKPLSKASVGIIARDDIKFMYPSDLKIDSEDYIWIMTNRLPIFIYSSLNPEEVNFRIYKVKLQDAIAGTVCAQRG